MKMKIIILFFISMQLYSIEIDSIPKSFTYVSDLRPLTKEEFLDKKNLKVYDNDSLKNEEKLLREQYPNLPDLYGVEDKVNFSTSNSGIWDTLENGGRLWRLRIKSPGATSINIVIRNIHFESNSYLFIYSSDKTDIHPPFYSKKNNVKKIISTALIKGDEVIVEYYEPKNVMSKQDFIISKVVHGFEDLIFLNKEIFNSKHVELQSGSCNRDVNCPEGDDWCREKYSVAMILMPEMDENFWGWCTGSLINNVRNDYTPYFLTAFHCLDHNHNGSLSDGEKENVEEWSFKFGEMREGCSSGTTLSTVVYSGAEFKSAYFYSDFALLELYEQPEPGEFNFPDVYFNGWDRTGDTPDNTTCIHHPDGDLMKISQDYDEPEISGNFWEVVWNTGTTEPGSSGSPLFTSQRKVIGQLCCGTASCDNPDGYDHFGRFDISWYGGGTSSTRLKDWLDPDNSGVEVLDGIHLPNCQWGDIYDNGDNFTIRAYDVLKVGSSDIPAPYVVESGATIIHKAGKEIHILPCTQILSGAEYRAFIQELDCDEVVYLSEREDEYSTSCGSYSLFLSDDEEPIEVTSVRMINDYSLFHNIPNPFSGITEIKYSLPSPNPVVIQIYNAIGMQVAELVNSPMQNAGEYSVTFDAKDLPDGVYFYTMRTPGFTETKQMILMR
jgi:lysyl endopeptidase